MLQCGSLWGTGLNLCMFGNKESFGSFLLINGVTVDMKTEETVFLFTVFMFSAQMTIAVIALPDFD